MPGGISPLLSRFGSAACRLGLGALDQLRQLVERIGQFRLRGRDAPQLVDEAAGGEVASWGELPVLRLSARERARLAWGLPHGLIIVDAEANGDSQNGEKSKPTAPPDWYGVRGNPDGWLARRFGL